MTVSNELLLSVRKNGCYDLTDHEAILMAIEILERRTSQPVAFVEREVLAELQKHKTASGAVCSGLLTRPFGDKVPLFTSRPSQGEPVAVKGLEWREEISGSWWTADAYRVEVFDGGGFAARVSQSQSRAFRTITHGVSFEAAKAAAQADYEQRIRSALVSAPSLAVSDEMVEAAAEVLWTPTCDAALRSTSHSKLRAALTAALEAKQ